MSEPLWSDERIRATVYSYESKKLMQQMRDEYEARIAELEQRVANSVPVEAIQTVVWFAEAQDDADTYYYDVLKTVNEWLERTTPQADTAHSEQEVKDNE